LSTHFKEKGEKILETIQHLTEESAQGTPIIVEGTKDLKALKTLGIEGKILTAKTGGKSRLDIISEIEQLNTKKIILLLDFDRRGKELTHQLNQHLEKTQTKPDLTFWKELSQTAGKDVKDIESLTTYLKNLQKKTGNTK
jgi:5S rRNA maturation endonuclease (ribonuclease M5)